METSSSSPAVVLCSPLPPPQVSKIHHSFSCPISSPQLIRLTLLMLLNWEKIRSAVGGCLTWFFVAPELPVFSSSNNSPGNPSFECVSSTKPYEIEQYSLTSTVAIEKCSKNGQRSLEISPDMVWAMVYILHWKTSHAASTSEIKVCHHHPLPLGSAISCSCSSRSTCCGKTLRAPSHSSE